MCRAVPCPAPPAGKRCPVPAVSGAKGCGSSQRDRHQQGRQDDAETGAAVIQADQKPGVTRMQSAQARRQHPAGNENEGAGYARQDALAHQQAGAGDKAGQQHEQRGQQRTGDQHPVRAVTPHQGRGHQRTDEIAECIAGIHRAGQQISPVQVAAHRRQQQRVGKARHSQRHRGAQRDGKRSQERVARGETMRCG